MAGSVSKLPLLLVNCVKRNRTELIQVEGSRFPIIKDDNSNASPTRSSFLINFDLIVLVSASFNDD